MTILILGLILWIGAHLFKRLMPAHRAQLGSAGRGAVTAALVVALALIIWGYRTAEFIPVWNPPSFFTHINNLLMLLAFWVFGSSAVKIWATAHLLVNGDLAAILLFGTMLGWAVSEVILINRAEPNWTPPPHAGRATYIRLIVISTILFLLVAAIHMWLGVIPFPH